MMTMDDETMGVWGDGGPPQMDESWWQAILEEEEGGARERPNRVNGSHEQGKPVGDPEDWAWAQDLYQRDDTVDLPVIGFNRGGLLIEARSLRGFVPASHVTAVEPNADGSQRADQLAQLVGETLCLKVIELDLERGRLVFSNRAALAGPGKRVEILEQLKSGDRVRGRVTNITRFGVFVDLGGIEGLIHVSELSWGRVRHPSDVVHCGQELEVYVLSVDREQDRVALSLKELLPDPWAGVEERYHVGQVVEGVVTNIVKFGAFIGLEQGLEGLIHISEFGDGDFLHPRSVLSEGEHLQVKIIHIDAPARRIGLSLRQLRSPSTESAEGEGQSIAAF